MVGVNRKYDLKVKVLTPLSIGAGNEKEWVEGVDYILHKDKLYKLNLRKLYESGVDMNRLAVLISSSDSKDKKMIVDLISETKLSEVSDIVLSMPSYSSNSVKSFLRNPLTNMPVLAGSSIKGAIRSVLYKYFMRNTYGRHVSEKDIFGSSIDGSEFMRFVKISDSEFMQTSLVNSKIYNLRTDLKPAEGAWKHKGGHNSESTKEFKMTGFNTLYECLMPGQTSCISIMFSEMLSNLHVSDTLDRLKSSIMNSQSPLEELFTIINRHTKDYLEKEKDFFCTYWQGEYSDVILDSIDDLLDAIPSDGSSCIIKMGAGSGFHSITGDWQYDNYCNGILGKGGKPKSRKIAIWDNGRSFNLMGFVQLSLLPDDMKQELESERKKVLEKEKVRLKKLEDEQMLKQQYVKEMEEKKEAFRRYIERIENSIGVSDWENALLLLNEVEQILPERSNELKAFWSKVHEAMTIKENYRIAEEGRRIEEEMSRLKNSVPLSERIANVNKLPTLLGNVKKWAKENQVDVLSNEEVEILYQKVLDIYTTMRDRDKKDARKVNFWKDISSLLEDGTVEKWINGLNKNE